MESKSVFVLTYLTPDSLAIPTEGDSTSSRAKGFGRPSSDDDDDDDVGVEIEAEDSDGLARAMGGVSIEPG